MTWLILVLPATFSEVIGISLKAPGSHGYLNNQLFIGIMYMAAFAFGMYIPKFLPLGAVPHARISR